MRWGCSRSAALAGVVAALGLRAGAARADDVDPSHGRVEGDLTLVVGAGAVLAGGGPRAEGELRLRYLETAGLFASYEDGPLVSSSADPRRVLATGLELRPLFLYRWLKGHETRRAWVDLAIDSLGLELGAAWIQPAGTGFASQAAVQAGLGLEVPLLGEASGPWLGLHGGARWSEVALATGTAPTADDREAFLAITLSWHQVVVAHVVDVGDEAPR